MKKNKNIQLLGREVVEKDYGSKVVAELDKLVWLGETWITNRHGKCAVTHLSFGNNVVFCFKQKKQILGYYYYDNTVKKIKNIQLLGREVVEKDYGSKVVAELDKLVWLGETWITNRHGKCAVTHLKFGSNVVFCFKQKKQILGYYYAEVLN